MIAGVFPNMSYSIMPQQEAYQLALGNIDINTRKYMFDFNPDTYKVFKCI